VDFMIPLSSTLDSEYMVHVGAWYAMFAALQCCRSA